MISEKEVVALTEQVRQVTDPQELPTFFEFVTAMAFSILGGRGDLAIMETGRAGAGRHQSLRSIVGVITNISLEHQAYWRDPGRDRRGEGRDLKRDWTWSGREASGAPGNFPRTWKRRRPLFVLAVTLRIRADETGR
jgi:hypothetical protein